MTAGSFGFTLNLAPAPGATISDVLSDLASRLTGFPHVATLQTTGTGTASITPAATTGGASWWTHDRAKALLKPMTPISREVVRYVAENAPVVPVNDVIAHFAMKNGQELGGRMASLGFALKKVPGATNPMPAGEEDYTIDPHVAQVLLEALKEFPKA